MRMFPNSKIGCTLWLMHALETFILTISSAIYLGIRIEYALYAELIVLAHCLITPILIVVSFSMLRVKNEAATVGLAIGVVGVATIFWLVAALNR
jgi:hypothetical protein